MESTEFALPPGTLLGNYKLLKPLGQGGFGITYIAWDNQLRRNIVLKECFPLGLCSRNPETGGIVPLPHTPVEAYRRAMDSLRKEAQTLASLNHERIVRVYDVFESYGSIFYVMPWLEGGSLRELMDDIASGKRSVSPEQVEHWLQLLLDGLEYLHRKGIYHRDIKPGNILFDERGLPVLIDFGAALNKPETTCTITQGEFSFSHASPEQMCGKGEIGPWTDFYSLSATWYELVSGISIESSLRRLMQDDVVPLTSMRFSLPWPRELLASIDRNLKLKPEERCQNAGQWKAWLQQGKPKGLRKAPSSRKPLYIGVASGVLGVLLLALAGAWLWQATPRTHVPLPTGEVPRNAKPSQEFKDALYKKIRDYYKLDDYLGKVDGYNQEADEATRQCLKEQKELQQELERGIQNISTSEEASEYSGIISHQYEALVKKWSDYSLNLQDRYAEDVTRPLSDIEDNVIASYPSETYEEEVLLPAMRDRMIKECNEAHLAGSFDSLDNAIRRIGEESIPLIEAALEKSNSLHSKEDSIW